MSLQVLVATINQTDYSLPDRMNIQSDALIGNQCGRNEVTRIDYQGYLVRYFSFAEQGVGLNRNSVLMRATKDICVLADDDQVFVGGYRNLILDKFQEYPDADVIIFNVYSKRGFIVFPHAI